MWRMERQWEGEDRGVLKSCFSPGSRGRRLFVVVLGVKWQQSYSENKGRANGSFLDPNVAKLWPHSVVCDTNHDRGEGYVIISDINDIRRLSAASEGITNYRRKKNMGHIH